MKITLFLTSRGQEEEERGYRKRLPFAVSFFIFLLRDKGHWVYTKYSRSPASWWPGLGGGLNYHGETDASPHRAWEQNSVTIHTQDCTGHKSIWDLRGSSKTILHSDTFPWHRKFLTQEEGRRTGIKTMTSTPWIYRPPPPHPPAITAEIARNAQTTTSHRNGSLIQSFLHINSIALLTFVH